MGLKTETETLQKWAKRHKLLIGTGPIEFKYFQIGCNDNPAWLAEVLFNKRFRDYNERMLYHVSVHARSHMGLMRVINKYFKKIATKGATYRILSVYKIKNKKEVREDEGK